MNEEERIINLEIKFSHQDEFLYQLNQVVTEQQKAIERLEKEILDIKRNFTSANGVDTSNRTLVDDRPPHY